MLSQISAHISQTTLTVIASASLLLAVLALIFATAASVRAGGLKKRYRQLVSGTEGIDMEQLINRNHEQVSLLKRELESLKQAIANHESRLQRKTSRTVVSRYNAFGEVGNDLSFSFALLDDSGNGAVLSSIYGREDSRVYAKPVEAGQSSYTLTPEEKVAIEGAMRST